jgi:superfamily II DNA helicase RecQ
VEDYLQEYGRGGRDGRPALALLFCNNGDEARLLRWLAKKTAERAVANGQRTPQQAADTLHGRHERISEMAHVAADNRHCFRAELNNALVGPITARRRSWARRLLDWAFTRHAKPHRSTVCCDVCNPELVGRLRTGKYVPAAPAGMRPDARRARR